LAATARSEAAPRGGQRAPLAGHAALDRPIAWRDGAPVSCARFLGEAARLAARLPPGAHLVNLCEDRYRFTVALAAALLAGKTSLFPQSRNDVVLERVAAAYPGCGAIAEEPAPVLGERLLRYPADLGGEDWAGPVPTVDAEHVAAIVFTSGSTGAPQPNVKRWGRLVATGHAGRAALGLRAGDFNVLGTVPPQHMYGFESTVLLALAAGGALHPGRPLLPRDVQAALEALPAPRVLVTSPIHIRACVEADVSFPPLEAIVSAAAPLGAGLAAAAERRFATRVVEIYGFTEAGQVAARRTTASPVWRALAGIRVLAAGDGWAVEGGPVHGRVPGSDLIRRLSETEFVLEGRATDLVNVAGKRAALGELNRALTAIPGVEDGAFHVPEHPGGRVERLMAFVVAPRLGKREILAALRRTVDPAFLPRPLVKLERLPRAPTGKLPLEALRALERAVAPNAAPPSDERDAG
jgi:acyl-coenzyme A synthetase/AMP-(fatty) acid ligase